LIQKLKTIEKKKKTYYRSNVCSTTTWSCSRASKDERKNETK
jgi:hypothetical protein